jgi:hypothetical protein
MSRLEIMSKLDEILQYLSKLYKESLQQSDYLDGFEQVERSKMTFFVHGWIFHFDRVANG